ncbi:MAG TPA: beta-galactosidase [Verrucomicrobiota bacterium]|nr:beta-galactosidase [Verrucomicrobiota bacterium]
MHFGVNYHPELWVHPFGGTAENPEAAWQRDAELMAAAGINVVRMGEYTWGLCEPKDGEFQFDWLRRAMDVMAGVGIETVLATPTAAPPAWLSQEHPEILPLDDHKQTRHGGTRRAACFNSDTYWEYSRRVVDNMARALGNHPNLIAWQIDNAIGGDNTEASFNEDSRLEWQNWLKLKYETIERLNNLLGLRHWGQVVTDWSQVTMPLLAPATHNPALVLDWRRFCSDTIVAFVKMQADVLREATPGIPLTTNLRPMRNRFDHFDLAQVLDFVSVDATIALKLKSAELACEIDMLRSIKKRDIKAPGGNSGFWVMEQKAGQVNWRDAFSLMRPGTLRLFTYQLISRGANAVLYSRWRQPRIGTEQFHGALLVHDGEKRSRTYAEAAQIGDELKVVGPALQDTRVAADVCILYTHDNEWALQLSTRPNKHFSLRDHIQLFYNALHDRNLMVDFAKPTEDLSRYKVVIAPSLHLLSGAEADFVKLYVQNGGTLVGTFNTGLVDEHYMAPDTGYPHDLTELFGLEVHEFDSLPPGEENHLSFKGAFSTSQMHPARIWCDLIEPGPECQVLATYSREFYAGVPAMTLNAYGLGKAIYVGTMSHQFFYNDLVAWLREICDLHPQVKAPDTIETSTRRKDDLQFHFLLNHQNTSLHVQLYKPMIDFLSGELASGGRDLPPHGVLILTESPEEAPATEEPQVAAAEAADSGAPSEAEKI